MTELLSAAGRSFLRAFAAALIVYSYGILAAPDLNKAKLLAVAALLGAVAAGLRSIQAYVPKLSLIHVLPEPFGAWADSFARAFIASLLLTLPGALEAPNLNTGRSLATAAVVGAFTAGLRALQGLLTKGEHPSPKSGAPAPRRPKPKP